MSSLGNITPEQEAELLDFICEKLSSQIGSKISVWPTEFLTKYGVTDNLLEKELKILEIDVGDVIKKIHEHAPTLIFHGSVKDDRYDFPQDNNTTIEETMRIRKKNNTYLLTIKKKNQSKELKERAEFEITLNHPHIFTKRLLAIGLVPVHIKRKIRYSYAVDNIIMDLDLYYTIPPLLEIEGENKEVIWDWIKKLGLSKKKVVNWSARETLLHYGKWE